MSRRAAARELHRDKYFRFVGDVYGLVQAKHWEEDIRAKHRVLLIGAYLWYKGNDNLWWLGQTHSADLVATDTYIVRLIEDP